MHALATKYVKLGRPNEAEGLAMETLTFREARQREDRGPVLHSKRLLAWIMTDQGRRGEAEELQRSLLETAKQTRGDGDALVTTLTNDLGLTLSDQDGTIEQRREAITLLEQIVDAWKTPEGEETVKSLAVLNNLAVVYMDAEIHRLEEAEALIHRVIRGSALLHGENNPNSLGQKSNLAQLFARQGKWAEAKALELEVLEIRKRTLGMDNPTTIQCLSSIGWVYSQQEDRLQEAKTIQLEVLERRMRVQGAAHPATIGIIGNLAETLSKLGEMKEARRYARMALGY
jgi:tetratricopeptide (TPR) repeat protein